MFRKILVPIDESHHARRAVDSAVDLAQRYDSSVCLLHAFPHVSDHLGAPIYDMHLQRAMMKGRELLDALYEEFAQKIPIETQLIEGPPAPAIIKVADAEHFDLIVIGSRGHGQVVNLLLGSVSSAVTQKAHCPVLVVH